MNECKAIYTVRELDEVSNVCKKSLFCQSKLLPDGNFSVTTFKDAKGCEDPRKVWMMENVTERNKIKSVDKMLEISGFHDVVREKCQGKKDCKIIIKTNFAPTTQKEFKGYTDPEIVEHVVDVLEGKGHKVNIVESETKLADLSPAFYPEILKDRLDPPYKKDIINLSKKERMRIHWKGGFIDVSKELVDADVIINMPKIKTLSEFFVSVALKNMYGALPDRDKYHLFHWQRSGFDVEDATLISNHATPVDFVIADGIITEDGGKTSSMHVDIEREHMEAKILMAGRDPLAIDKLVSTKVGFPQNKGSITNRVSEFRGDFDVNPELIEHFIVKENENGIELKRNDNVDKKYEIMHDAVTGKRWKKPTLGEHLFLNTFQFILPRVFGVPDRLMKVVMCGLVDNFTVMKYNEKEEACTIDKIFPAPPSTDWT